MDEDSRTCATSSSRCGAATSGMPRPDRYAYPSSRTRGRNENSRPSLRTYPSLTSVSRKRRVAALVSPVALATSLRLSRSRSGPKALMTARPRSSDWTKSLFRGGPVSAATLRAPDSPTPSAGPAAAAGGPAPPGVFALRAEGVIERMLAPEVLVTATYQRSKQVRLKRRSDLRGRRHGRQVGCRGNHVEARAGNLARNDLAVLEGSGRIFRASEYERGGRNGGQGRPQVHSRDRRAAARVTARIGPRKFGADGVDDGRRLRRVLRREPPADHRTADRCHPGDAYLIGAGQPASRGRQVRRRD